MKKLISVRLNQLDIDIVNKHAGTTFTNKLTNTILYSVSFSQKEELERLKLEIKDADKTLVTSLNHLAKLRKGFNDLILKHCV